MIERSAVLFLLTSAVNVLTLVLVGLGLATGLLPGPEREALAILPVAVGLVVLAFFLVLPNTAERLAAGRDGVRLRRTLVGLASSVRDTERFLRTPDWRLLGAVGYLWLDIVVLIACFAALGEVPPLAAVVLAYQIGYLASFVPIPGGIGALDASLIGMLVIYGVDLTTATAATPPTGPSRSGSQRSGGRLRSWCCSAAGESRSPARSRRRGGAAADVSGATLSPG